MLQPVVEPDSALAAAMDHLVLRCRLSMTENGTNVLHLLLDLYLGGYTGPSGSFSKI